MLLTRSSDTVILTRAGTLAPSSIDEEARTVDLTWSTGAPVRRIDHEGAYVETLSLDPAHVDLSRLRGGPLLDSHRSDSLGRVLGAVVDASVDGRQGVATVKFSGRSEVEAIWQDVKAGVLRSFSIGYAVTKWQDGRAADGTRERKAVAWAPREISLVAVPADPGATVRKEPTLDPATETAGGGDAATRAVVNQEIRTLTEASGFGREVADDLIDRAATADEARIDLFNRMQTRTAAAGTIRHQRVEGGASGDDPSVRKTRMQDALVCRVTGQKPSAEVRPYMHLKLLDMAREVLADLGERGLTYLGEDETLRRAHTVGDFSNFLSGVGNRVTLQAFEAAASPLLALAKSTTINDFRQKSTLKLSGIGRLEEVAESGEIKSTTRAEAAEAYRLKTFARMFALTRQAIINDDLGAFGDFSAEGGRAAADTIATELVGLLTANSGNGVNLSDNNPLFGTARGNKAASGGAIGVTTLGAARQAMREQKSLGGTSPINVVPKFLLVSPAKETLAEQILASIYAATPSDANPFSGRLQLLVEPRLSGNPWWVFADPTSAPVLEYAYLSSAQGPQIASREGWDVLGTEFRVVLDFGCGAVDHRGAYLNPGA